jgi:biopolymer transport protein ExbD
VDLTPLIDVIFMLIIFFVLAGTFSKPVLEVLLPHTETAEPAGGIQQKELIVTIDQQGRILCGDHTFPIDRLDELVALSPAQKMNLYVDERAPFKPFIAVIDRTRAAGRTNVVITTEKK